MVTADHDKYIFAISALRRIAWSYKERIDRADTSPADFADLVLRYLGDDGSWTDEENNKANELHKGFRAWRVTEGE